MKSNNTPHVTKYDAKSSQRGIRLHNDASDYTFNIMLSPPSAYEGGGTHFTATSETYRLDLGEGLLHPGNLLHRGVEISKGERYILVGFCDLIR